MSHMEPEITDKTDWLEVESKDGTYWVELQYAPHWPVPANVEVPGDFIHPNFIVAIAPFTRIPSPDDIYYITLRSGYGVRLSAPGYLDCTEWEVFATLSGAQERLKELEEDDGME